MHCGACRPPWFALAACVMIGLVVRIRACDPEYPHSAPRIVWVDDGYVALWAEHDGKTTVLQAARSSGTGAKRSRLAGRAVWRSEELQSQALLAGGDKTALVVALEGPEPDPDPEEDRSDPSRFLTVLPLGADGRALGMPRSLGHADRICASPTWDGARFVVAFAYRMRHFGDDWVLQLGGISSVGVLEHTQRIASGYFGGCALARRGEELAVVVAVHDRQTQRYALLAYFVDARDHVLLGEPLVVARDEERAAWPQVVAERDGWAASFAGAHDEARLVRFDRGGVRDARTLDGVDADTMSLGTNATGVFAAWHADGRVRLRGLDGGGTRSLARAARTDTTAVGHDRECAIAWSDRKGALLSRVPSPCP